MPLHFDRLAVLCIAIIVASIAYTAGRYRSAFLLQERTPVQIVDDVNVPVPVVELRGVEDNVLRGTVQGNVRFFMRDDMVLPDEEGEFSVAADQFFVNYVRVIVPEGMKFVASRRGTRYYSVTSAAGENLSVDNRVYFRSEAEAERAGYVPGS